MKARAAGLPRKAAVSARAVPASSHPQAEAAYAALARRFIDQPRVSVPAGKRGKFGSNALKVDGKIFAMLVKGALAVKLSPAAIELATAAGRGEPLSMGRGRVMKEWLLVKDPSPRWYGIAERARAFVAGEAESAIRTPAARPEEATGRPPRPARRKR